MPNSVRPWITAGVAMVGAGLIAVTPPQPAPTEVRVATAAVLIDAAPSPFEYYPQVVQRSLGSAGDRLDEYLADPAPVLRALAHNRYRAVADVADPLPRSIRWHSAGPA